MDAQSTSERFWSKVDKSGECWIWLAQRDRKGYGRFHMSRELGTRSGQLAHRAAWYLTTGAMPPPTTLVCHHCDNPSCVRPDHLFLGAPSDNTQDMLAKGRGVNGAQAWRSRTHGERNSQAKLTESQVIEIRQRAIAGEYFRDIAPDYGISATNCNRIINGGTWRNTWPYDEDHPPQRVVLTRRRRTAPIGESK